MTGTDSATPRHCRYSCASAAQTLEWMSAIAEFLGQHKPLVDAHVVSFFKDKLWEVVEEEWMECLRKEPVENLLRIPSGFFMDHWPDSLQEFVRTVESLVMPREQEALCELFPGLEATTLDCVLAQGMNPKKKHEIGILAALVNAVANNVGAEEIVDVGAGQGYLAQVLTFQYEHRVTAIDASSHHSVVTSARAERIRKHYAAKLLKNQAEGNKHFHVPQAVTCQILSSSSLRALTNSLRSKCIIEHTLSIEDLALRNLEENNGMHFSCNSEDAVASLVLAGLHACGDLSVTMLRTFVESEQVKALVCIGCCYNLLSEGGTSNPALPCGFPLSSGAKLHGINLGKNARDLSCQSADRWRNLSKNDALQNFDLHAFRAAFQMVLNKYFPEVLVSSPSIGRQGKALRRQRMRRVLHSKLNNTGSVNVFHDNGRDHFQGKINSPPLKFNDGELDEHPKVILSISDANSRSTDCSFCEDGGSQGSCLSVTLDKYKLFKEFTMNGLRRLGFDLPEDVDFDIIWKELQPFFELVGPFWSLRASLGPLLETYILLDRLLFLQEHALPMKTMIFPLFDPSLSPRNVVIVAQKFC